MWQMVEYADDDAAADDEYAAADEDAAVDEYAGVGEALAKLFTLSGRDSGECRVPGFLGMFVVPGRRTKAKVSMGKSPLASLVSIHRMEHIASTNTAIGAIGQSCAGKQSFLYHSVSSNSNSRLCFQKSLAYSQYFP